MQNAGPMTYRITFQARAPGVDSHGQTIETWQDIPVVPTVWADKRQPRGREYFGNGQMQAVSDLEFVIRYRTDIDPSMSILCQGLRYEMSAPPLDPDGRKVKMIIGAMAGVRDGR